MKFGTDEEWEAECLVPDVVKHFIAAVVRPGDWVQLDLHSHGRLGMDLQYHGAWVEVSRGGKVSFMNSECNKRANYWFSTDGPPPYGFYEHHIMGWRRPKCSTRIG